MRSFPGLLKWPWTYVVAGMALIAFAAILFVTTHPARPVRIDSHVADYLLETKDGKYYANHLKLAGNSTDYVFDRTEFQPSTPETMPAGAPITVWVDEGGTMVLAIDLAGQTYSKASYRDPNVRLRDDRLTAEVLGAVGVVLIVIGFLVSRLMKRGPHRDPPPQAGEGVFREAREGRGRLVP